MFPLETEFYFCGFVYPVVIEAFVVIVLVGFCFVLEVSWTLSFAAYGSGEGRLGSWPSQDFEALVKAV